MAQGSDSSEGMPALCDSSETDTEAPTAMASAGPASSTRPPPSKATGPAAAKSGVALAPQCSPWLWKDGVELEKNKDDTMARDIARYWHNGSSKADKISFRLKFGGTFIAPGLSSEHVRKWGKQGMWENIIYANMLIYIYMYICACFKKIQFGTCIF